MSRHDGGGSLRRALGHVRPTNADQLHAWLEAVLDIRVPRRPICDGHDAPMAYLEHVFFEREGDPIVWANRGGGKTFYGAVATMLDLLFKPGIEVRILGGSMDQSRRMYHYLRQMFDRPGLRHWVAGRWTQRGVRLRNGSGVELLAQSQTSVRGHRVHKLRCDEVELFDRRVWQAAQFTTRSARCGGKMVRGSVEALSTVHRPFGLMHELIEQAAQSRRAWKVIRWCALDVIERCPAERLCERCDIESACQGAARRGRGFIRVEDVIAQRHRSTQSAFDCEMMCRRPTRSDAVYAMFDPATHVRAVEPIGGEAARWVGGMDFGMRSPFVMLWAQWTEAAGGAIELRVMDEYVRSEATVDEHLRAMSSRRWPMPDWIGADPAGHQRSEQTGTSTIGLFRRAGYVIRAEASPLWEGIEAVRRWLDPTHPRRTLVIHPRCRRLIESLTGYHFDADHPHREAPVKDGHDHAADALRYMIVQADKSSRPVNVRVY